jgi:EAL domain-containing protein (putative c-di-GMP-specific phosphodiesterase class I)
MPQLNIDDTKRSGLAVPFEMQPILTNPGMALHSYELLYRGPRPASWPVVDMVLLNYIKTHLHQQATLFINLSNETILAQDLAAYIPPCKRSSVYIELSESMDAGIDYHDIAQRVNAFTNQGIRFAIDDFGSGLDGLHRYAALKNVAVVKLDRLFLRQAAGHPTSRRILELLIAEWSRSHTVTVAEGVENVADLAFASSLGVQMVQGFHIDDIHAGRVQEPLRPAA